MRVALVVACVALAAGTAFSAQEVKEAKVLTHRGWEGCVELSNGDTRIVVAPAVGARLVVFAHKDTNVMFVDPTVDGKTLKPNDGWMPWDGSQPDTISPSLPGKGRQLKQIWMHPYKIVQSTPLSVKLASAENKEAGIRVEKEFILDPAKPTLTIHRRIVNLTDKPAQWSFWERWLIGAPAIGLAPINPRSKLPEGWGIDAQDKDAYVPGASQADGPHVVDGLLMVRTEGKGTKVGLDAAEGWTAGLINGLLLTMKYPVYDQGEIPRTPGISNVFYFADNRLEFEPVSPYLTIAPGQSAQWTITCTLTPFGETPADPKALVAKARQLVR